MLIERVEAAIELAVAPSEVESFVGKKAVINTLRPDDWAVLSLADIGPDSGCQLPDFDTVAEVVYWKRPIAVTNPKMIGIVWTKAGSPLLFFAVCYIEP